MRDTVVIYRHGALKRECVGRDCRGAAEYVATIVVGDEGHRRVVTLCLCEKCAEDFMVNHPEDSR